MLESDDLRLPINWNKKFESLATLGWSVAPGKQSQVKNSWTSKFWSLPSIMSNFNGYAITASYPYLDLN